MFSERVNFRASVKRWRLNTKSIILLGEAALLMRVPVFCHRHLLGCMNSCCLHNCKDNKQTAGNNTSKSTSIFCHRISEVGGSEFAFRRAPRNREIVLCHACVRAEPMLGGNASQT
jgi:hypothetical protein